MISLFFRKTCTRKLVQKWTRLFEISNLKYLKSHIKLNSSCITKFRKKILSLPRAFFSLAVARHARRAGKLRSLSDGQWALVLCFFFALLPPLLQTRGRVSAPNSSVDSQKHNKFCPLNFSNHWKLFFQSLEKLARIFQPLEKSFPIIGKFPGARGGSDAGPGLAGCPRCCQMHRAFAI
ncbi:MAG: hypothetical protein IKQ55_00985 [Kiritimatiellae bacterium]|nr:hypothetical protein [Kiritimatiellia bacterium]